MKTITKTCLYCLNNFEASLKEHKRGKAHYCSLSCAAKKFNQSKPLPVANCTCSFCQKNFYRPKGQQTRGKSGLQFCSRECKDQAQRLDSPITQIRPPHYGTGKANYREIAKRSLDMSKCANCSYNKNPKILEVHHIDGDRNNNSIANLMVLCPNCHQEIHFLSSTGRFKGNSLT